MDDKFTVICPTLWLSESFPKFLPKLVECDLIDEILIINNNKRFTPTIAPHEKLKVCTPEENLGVNKSWNIGVVSAKNNKLAIINDDVVFNTDVFEYMLPHVSEDKGLIGLNLNTEPSSYELVKTEHRYFGYACLFFIHKSNYSQIPESLKIYFGDDWLFESTKKRGLINYYLQGFKIEGELSQTSKYFYSEYFSKEKEIYNLEINKL